MEVIELVYAETCDCRKRGKSDIVHDRDKTADLWSKAWYLGNQKPISFTHTSRRVANTKDSQPPHARHHPQQSIAASAVGCMPCSNGRAHPRPITDSAEAVRCSARLDSLPSSQRQPCVPLAENPCGS